ncbi:MAG TPA: MFS transporter [Acidimicrobiia bacterium]|nr:MFS transporter [Acidimicrobiia bacterium]
MTSPPGDGPLITRGRHLATQRGLGPRFSALYAGAAVSLLGTYVAYLTVPLLVADTIGSDRALPFSTTYALETVPTLIFGLVGGVILDRVRLRWAMILANLVRAGAFFYLASTVGSVTLGTIYALAFLIGSFSAVYENALFAIIPSLVSQENLAKANGRIAATQAAMFAAGPMLAGGLALVAGPEPGLWSVGGAFLASSVAIYLVGPVGFILTGEEEQKGFIEETLNGLRFLIGEHRLRDSTITAAAANVVFGFIEGTFIVMATTVLETESEFQIGVLIVAFGLGAILGSTIADRVIRVLGLGRTMIGGVVTMAAGMGLLVFSRFGVAALAFAFLMFVGIGLVNVPIATIRQVYTPPAMLGRVITASRALSWGTLPIGALLGGLLAAQIDYVRTIRLTPALLILLAVWLFTTPLWSDTFGPSHRRLRSSAQKDEGDPDDDEAGAGHEEVNSRQAEGQSQGNPRL